MLNLKNWLLARRNAIWNRSHCAWSWSHPPSPARSSRNRARQTGGGRRLAATDGNGSINWRGRFPWPVRRLNSRSFLTQLPTALRGNPGHSSPTRSSVPPTWKSWTARFESNIADYQTSFWKFIKLAIFSFYEFSICLRGGSTSVTRFDRPGE